MNALPGREKKYSVTPFTLPVKMFLFLSLCGIFLNISERAQKTRRGVFFIQLLGIEYGRMNGGCTENNANRYICE